MTDLPLNANVAPLEFLLGTWQGEGKGAYPTIADFGYGEEINFAHVGRPFLAYRQRTWALDDGRPLHAESGYFRVGGADSQAGWRIEAVLAHPTGVVEVETGTLSTSGDRHTLVLSSTSVAATPSAKQVAALARRIQVDGDDLDYELDMAAVGQALQGHLWAHLSRG